MRREKLITLAATIAEIPDGATVALGGSLIRRHPMALVHELIRQKKRDLVLLGWNNGIDFDMLVGAGCVREVYTAYVGLSVVGLARNYRRAVEAGRIRVVEQSETTAIDAFRAGSIGLTFTVSRTPLGSDLMKNPEMQHVITCPFTGEKYVALKAFQPDYALVHASFADRFGNVGYDARRMQDNETDVLIAKSARQVIATVEQVVSEDYIIQNNHLVLLPKIFVHSVVEAPYGAHPNSCDTRYDHDLAHFQAYYEASATAEGFRQYLDRYVFGCADWMEYLEQIGLQRLLGFTRPKEVV